MSDSSSSSSAMDRYLTPLALFVGLVIIAAALMFGKGVAPQAGNEPQQIAVNIKDVKTETSPYIGDPNAPVVMAVWFDYQCPFCKQYELTTIKSLNETYVKEGKLKIVFKDFQFLGPDSQDAALFARAVWEAYPDRFHSWYQAVMNAQDEEHGGFGNLESIKKLSATVEGIDVAKVESLLNANKSKYEVAIAADRAEGQAFGINSTPSSIIGTQALAGAVPLAQVKALVDAELAK
jgi:protein-disulfide isomerase